MSKWTKFETVAFGTPELKRGVNWAGVVNEERERLEARFPGWRGANVTFRFATPTLGFEL